MNTGDKDQFLLYFEDRAGALRVVAVCPAKSHNLSTMVAIPMPPPTHSVAKP